MKAGLAFWLRVVEARGGLAEPSGDAALIMLPPSLETLFELPAELAVTDDPDVAREDGIAFLGPGHPAIAKAADALLAEADIGIIQLAPAGHSPDLGTLQDKARLRFPVAHGRIDLVEAPRPGSVVILRMGALVRYALSEEDHYQEAIDQWIDATTCLPVDAAVASRLLAAPRAPVDPTVTAVSDAAVTQAVLTAYHEIDAAASRRRTELAKDVAGARREEVARAESYYAAALESIAKRRATAAPDRRALLDARADSTRAEKARRLEEITEKYRGIHETQPFRLHLLHVPALRIDAQVRRGDRRYPLSLTWLPVAAQFAGVRCPTCQRQAPLDAGKTRLGCIACQTKAPVVPPPRPPAPATSAPRNSGPAAGGNHPEDDARTRAESRVRAAGDPPAARASNGRPTATAPSTARPPGRAAPPSPRTRTLTGKPLDVAGAKLAFALWQANVDGDNRAMKRLTAARSPMSTAYRLFRSLAPAVCVGLPAGALPQEITSWSAPHRAPGHYVTVGEIVTGTRTYPCTVLWREAASGREIVQVSPFAAGLLGRHLGAGSPRHGAGAWPFEQCPAPVEPLDEVAATVWQTAAPRLGIPTAVRALTSWWRFPDPDLLSPRFPAAVIAAALERAACYWGGEGPGGYDAAAGTYRVAVEDVRKVGAILQKTLKLAPELPW